MKADEITADLLLSGVSGIGDLSRKFAQYWLSLPKTDGIPSRTDFHPEQIPDLLPYMVIHELIAPDLITLRLAGTAMAETYGKDITGMNYLSFVEKDRRAKASEAIFLVCRHPAGMLVQLLSTTESGMLINRESIAFPIRDDTGSARFVYFCSSPVSERKYSGDERDELQVMAVKERTYLDIGAGTPDFSE